MYASAGFDVLNLANNHAFDYGAEGQRQTLEALDRVNLGHVGRPGQILIRRVRGTEVALLGFAPYPWAAQLLDTPAAQRLVRRADRLADVVVVMIHAGAEGADRMHTPKGVESAYGESRGDSRAFSHAVVDAGADLVLGSGPHVLRGIERYRQRLIAYSLGNFLGHHTFERGGVLSLSGILRVRIDASGRPQAGRWVSIRLAGSGVPKHDSTGASARLVTGLSRDDFGGGGVAIDGRGRLIPPPTRAAVPGQR
jgi:poly-gamma-glutamate capsule biosynthesis protein CapA/YwtB (metallophosphatase superfamily)